MTTSHPLCGQITAPPRSTPLGAVLLVALILILGLSQFVPLSSHFWIVVFDLTLLALPVSIASRSIYTIHFNVYLVCYWLDDFFPHFSNFYRLTPLTLYAFTVVCIPALRHSVGWLRPGKSNRNVWVLSMATIILASVALIAWVHYLNPDLRRYSKGLPKLPPTLMILFAIGFSGFNAAAEEIIWRGVMLEALDSALGPGFWPLAIQAASFGIGHYKNGFPSGAVGVCMVFPYGLVLGAIRRLSKGMVYCWLVHVVADSTIFCLTYLYMHTSK